MTNELVQQTAPLPDRAQVEQQLGELAISGDTNTLREIALQASAYQEYEKRQQAKVRADEFGRVKVLAEAHIGLIDIRENPRIRDEALKIGDAEVGRHLRRQWRILGSGLQRGALQDVIDQAAKDEFVAVSTFRTYQDLLSRGVAWVPAPILRKQYLKLNGTTKNGRVRRGPNQPVSAADIAERSGVPHRLVSRYLSTNCKRVPHIDATRIALAMGLDPLELGMGVPQSLRRAQNKNPQRKPHRPRKLRGGRLDETYSLVRRALQELDRVAGQNGKYGTAEAWNHLYEAEEILGRALKRAR